MLKKLRERSKNKKGFTMVELIVVIVIILVLAGALVPSLMKYMDSAKKASCKADGATLFTQVQSDYASIYAEGKIMSVLTRYNDVWIWKDQNIEDEINNSQGKVATFRIDAVTNEFTEFAYYDGEKYIAEWTSTAGWTVEEYTKP